VPISAISRKSGQNMVKSRYDHASSSEQAREKPWSQYEIYSPQDKRVDDSPRSKPTLDLNLLLKKT
jgi:hypothetical protein